ncbi:hypothetical protein CPB84DRAFT_781191 [Gymnopilus junonius]|uniref:Uncharacterized protein n=1 Tax=Gymnopilus junonius TaxID=109634 RepID=A0A9P5NNP5_GYMJU|nr:hypothetical protein CPB84DRAFT_781191 [Gymnopilus junonius]
MDPVRQSTSPSIAHSRNKQTQRKNRLLASLKGIIRIPVRKVTLRDDGEPDMSSSLSVSPSHPMSGHTRSRSSAAADPHLLDPPNSRTSRNDPYGRHRYTRSSAGTGTSFSWKPYMSQPMLHQSALSRNGGASFDDEEDEGHHNSFDLDFPYGQRNSDNAGGDVDADFSDRSFRDSLDHSPGRKSLMQPLDGARDMPAELPATAPAHAPLPQPPPPLPPPPTQHASHQQRPSSAHSHARKFSISNGLMNGTHAGFSREGLEGAVSGLEAESNRPMSPHSQTSRLRGGDGGSSSRSPTQRQSQSEKKKQDNEDPSSAVAVIDRDSTSRTRGEKSLLRYQPEVDELNRRSSEGHHSPPKSTLSTSPPLTKHHVRAPSRPLPALPPSSPTTTPTAASRSGSSLGGINSAGRVSGPVEVATLPDGPSSNSNRSNDDDVLPRSHFAKEIHHDDAHVYAYATVVDDDDENQVLTQNSEVVVAVDPIPISKPVVDSTSATITRTETNLSATATIAAAAFYPTGEEQPLSTFAAYASTPTLPLSGSPSFSPVHLPWPLRR